MIQWANCKWVLKRKMKVKCLVSLGTRVPQVYCCKVWRQSIWSFCWTLILTQFSPKWSRAVFGIYHHTKSENDIPKNFGALDCKHNQLHNPSLRGGITKSHWTDVSNFHFTKAKLKAKANSLSSKYFAFTILLLSGAG